MFRCVEEDLKQWSQEKKPCPILLRGARQVGKTYIVEKFAKENFSSLLKINFEKENQYHKLFEANLDMKEILQKIAIDKAIPFDTNNTLVFFDEIQECPRAITALRYIYEDLPGLRCIGAGSALEFAITEHRISFPVGRIRYIYMHPISFYEYLETQNSALLERIKSMDLNNVDQFIHETALKEFKRYMFLGGMPKVLDDYFTNNNYQKALEIQAQILDTYRDDFQKYARKAQHNLLEQILISCPKLVGHKFKYSQISRDAQSREVKQALDILLKAKVIKQVRRTSGADIPLEFEASHKDFKVIFLDIGLMHKLLDLSSELLDTDDIYGLAAGALAEQVVGQELICHGPHYEDAGLYYWERDGRNISAEVDYLVTYKQRVIGLEVKAGPRGKLKSLYSLMNSYKQEIGICVSPDILSWNKGILKIPIYATQEIDRLVENIVSKHNLQHPHKD